MSNIVEQNELLLRIMDWNEERGNTKYNPKLEYDMLKEELTEYLSGIIEGDIVEQADAIGDLIFVATGSLFKLVHNDPAKVLKIIDIITTANQQKTGEKDANGKVIKPKGFVEPQKQIHKLLEEDIERWK